MTRRPASLLIPFLLLSIAALGQTQGAPQSADAGQKTAVAMPVIVFRGVLARGLNSKTATVGQAFLLKTEEALKLTNGTEIPAGSDIAGHVLQSAARANGAPESILVVTFDTLQAKGAAAPFPIRGIVQAFTGPAPVSVSAPAVGDMRTESTGGGVTGARVPSSEVHGELQTASAGADLNEKSLGVVGVKNLTLKAAPVNGVDASTFSSAEKSVKLEDGSRMMLRIALKQ